jgi:very-short-patch-repair endonuclease
VALDSGLLRMAPDLVGRTARLVQFLRELARTRQSRQVDLASYQGVYWLDELPAECDVLTDAGRGDRLFAVEAVTSEPPPPLPRELRPHTRETDLTKSDLDAPPLQRVAELKDELRDVHTGWLRRWQVWAEADRVIAGRRTWHANLSDAARQLDQRDDEIELVLATGLLSWETSDGTPIYHHLLHTPVRAVIDASTGRVDVLLAPDALTHMNDRDLLQGRPEFNASAVEPLREALRIEPPFPLADEIKATLVEWRRLSLRHCHEYDHSWTVPERPTTAATLTFAPALILRRRDQLALIQYYDRMLDVLSGPDAEAPLGLAQLLEPLEPDQRLDWLVSEGGTPGEDLGSDPLFPLPTNPEQGQIMDRLRGDNGVVVQGPPGTGKTHTIANLISALLARGQRVLVTSQKSQALRVLHEKLPDEVRQLCVSITDLGRGGSSELDRSVGEISSRFDGFSPEASYRQATALATRRGDERRRVAAIKERIRALREAETYQHPEIAPGFSGTLARVVERVQQQRSEFAGWMPVPMPATASPFSPVEPTEAADLRHLLMTETAERKARLHQRLPELGTLPSAAAMQQLFGAESAAVAHAEAAATPTSQQLGRLDDEWLGYLDRKVAEINRALDAAGLAGAPYTWSDDWRRRALDDHFARRDAAVWQQLAVFASELTAALQALQALALRDVVLPPADGPGGLAGQLAAAQALFVELQGGYKVKRRFRNDAQKQAQALLDAATVDGVSPETPERLEVVLAHLAAEQRCRTIASHWSMVGLAIDPGLPLVMRLSRLHEASDALAQITAVAACRDELAAALTTRGMPVALRSIDEWLVFAEALLGVRLRLEAARATAAVAEAREQVVAVAVGDQAPPELAYLVKALDDRDQESYGRALLALAAAHDEQRDQSRFEELYRRLHEGHPGLARSLAVSASDAGWEARLARLPQGWAWAKAATFVEEQRECGLEDRLDAELADALAGVAQTTAELAAADAWRSCLARMNAKQAQALRAYQQHMSVRGKGTGRWSQRYERSAREAMMEARDAVPAWIMPIAEVLQTIPPDRNPFDVVIVDEASQAGIDALFLLWLAPRVIVVGDDRQCTPSEVSLGALQPVYDKLDDYLGDVPEYLRLSFTPKSSLYSLLSTRFGSVVRLREHFRCMPEIIDWSSRQFYDDQPLVPLRQYGADRLPPLRTTHVEAAFTEGSGSYLSNPAEADAIVDQIVACTEDPAYDGKTFGVVVLQGARQVNLIEGLLAERLPVDERERRHLRVGIPPDFQGDERHVIFLSLVVAERRSALTRSDQQRRFNVAASRAQDQMWLFHSVTPDLLKPADLRRSLLTYLLSPPAPRSGDSLADVHPDEKHPDFDSLFEQRVYLRIRERGFHVTPQYEVNGRRIDLVVTGAKGRLAVECDGEAWHSTPEQRADDLDRELELKRAGWEFWRVRESDFSYDPGAALDGLWTALEKRGIEPGINVDPNSDEDPRDDDDWSAVPLPADDDPTEPDDEIDPEEERAVRERAPRAAPPPAIDPIPADDAVSTAEVRA